MKTPMPLVEALWYWMVDNGDPYPYFVYMIVQKFGGYYARVGYSGSLYSRLNTHMNNAPEWPKGIYLWGFENEMTARECEATALKLMKPYRSKRDWSCFYDLEHLAAVFDSLRIALRHEFDCSLETNEFYIVNSADDEHYHGYKLYVPHGVIHIDRQKKKAVVTCDVLEADNAAAA